MSVSAENLLDQFLAEVQPPANSGTAASRALKRGVNYSHEAMIDMILAQPGITQNELASRFGYTPAWISTVLASDAFQSAYAKRRNETVDPALVATLELQFKGLVARSLEVLREKLSGPTNTISDNLALKTLDISAKAAGFGARAEPQSLPSPEVHVHLHELGERLATLNRRVINQEPLNALTTEVFAGK